VELLTQQTMAPVGCLTEKNIFDEMMKNIFELKKDLFFLYNFWLNIFSRSYK